jgi:hypothetical protein
LRRLDRAPALARTTEESFALGDGHKRLARFRAGSDRSLFLSTRVGFSPRRDRGPSGRPRARRDAFHAEFHAAIHADACEPCAIATSKHLPSGPASPQSRDADTPGYRAKQILIESQPAIARCSGQGLFDRAIPPGPSQKRKYRCSARECHRLDRNLLRLRLRVTTSCAGASARCLTTNLCSQVENADSPRNV